MFRTQVDAPSQLNTSVDMKCSTMVCSISSMVTMPTGVSASSAGAHGKQLLFVFKKNMAIKCTCACRRETSIRSDSRMSEFQIKNTHIGGGTDGGENSGSNSPGMHSV